MRIWKKVVLIWTAIFALGALGFFAGFQVQAGRSAAELKRTNQCLERGNITASIERNTNSNAWGAKIVDLQVKGKPDIRLDEAVSFFASGNIVSWKVNVPGAYACQIKATVDGEWTFSVTRGRTGSYVVPAGHRLSFFALLVRSPDRGDGRGALNPS